MTYLGDFRTGKTVRHAWMSNAIAGESVTRATNGTVQVYKDGNTTQSTAGVTDTEDFDSLTGVHLVVIDTSADGTFYSAGSDFIVALSGATIDGKAINAALFSFSLENRSHLMPTTDGRKLDVSAGGEAGVDWANVGSPTTALNLSGTTVKTATDIATQISALDTKIDTIDNFLDTEVAAILADTDELQADLTDGGRLDLLIDAIKAKTDNLPSGVKKNTALNNFSWLMVDSGDHVTPKTGLTVTCQRSIDGAAFANCNTASATEVANGVYKVNLAASDLNGTIITFRFTAAGADARLITIKTND